jgi:hypothetical protein
MLGIKHYQKINSDYIEQFILEYGIVHRAQAFTILKMSGCKKAERNWQITNGLRRRKFFEFGDYFVREPQFDEISEEQRRMVKSLWVLLEYIDVADRHYALSEFTNIGFETGESQIEIAVVGPGEENSAAFFLGKARAEMLKKMSYALLMKFLNDKEAQAVENTKYIVIVEEEGQINKIQIEQVLSFALVCDTGKTSFYTI